MLLAVDVGNTNTVLGLFDGPRIAHRARISTTQRTGDELALLVQQILPVTPSAIVVGSVVPSAVRVLTDAARRLSVPLWVVDANNVPLPVRVPDRSAIGPDRVINAVAAAERTPAPFVVIDFGTATTFDAVDASGAFVGGAIAPGLGIAADALVGRTARLPRVELLLPPAAIGTDTVDAMRSGLMYGYAGLVDGLARRIKAELSPGSPNAVRCVATGGLASLLVPVCEEIDVVEPDLTLHGLRLCHERK